LSAATHHGAPVVLTGRGSHPAGGLMTQPRIIVRERASITSPDSVRAVRDKDGWHCYSLMPASVETALAFQ